MMNKKSKRANENSSDDRRKMYRSGENFSTGPDLANLPAISIYTFLADLGFSGPYLAGALLEPQTVFYQLLWGLSLSIIAICGPHTRMVLFFIPFVLSIPWIYFHSNLVRALFGLASLMLSFRILEIVRDKNFFLQCPIFFRVAFIYKYHDLRICQQHHNFSAIGKKRKLESVLTNLFDIAWCTVAIVLVLLLIKVFKHIVNYNGIVVYWALCTVFSYYAIHLVDFGYRLNAALMDIHVPASMLSPYLSRSVSEFWSRRWNLSVQSMLYDAFYRSIRDAFNASGIPLKPSNAHFVGIAFTFMGSAFLHAYPLLIVHAAWRDIVCMCLFFFFQIPLVFVEKVFNLESWYWFAACICLTCPLFAHPCWKLLNEVV